MNANLTIPTMARATAKSHSRLQFQWEPLQTKKYSQKKGANDPVAVGRSCGGPRDHHLTTSLGP